MNLLMISLLTVFLYLASRTRQSQATHCQPARFSSCFGRSINHTLTSLALLTDSSTQEEAQANLRLWEPLKVVPLCWSVLEPLLCALYMPDCEHDTPRRPCRWNCLAVKEPCRVVPQFYKEWPDFFRCDRFPEQNCLNITQPEVTNQSLCRLPLVETRFRVSWYSGVSYCGLQCSDPFFSKQDHDKTHLQIGLFGSVAVVCTLCTVATFLIEWRSQGRYPAVLIFYINACFCCSYLGWLLQFVGDTRTKTVCHTDGTMRLGEPQRESGYGWCLISFMLVYYFSIAGCFWFIFLSYSWFVAFRSLGKSKVNLSQRAQIFHVVSWILPFLLTVSVILLEQIDGSSLSGICFVGYRKREMRAVFLLLPLGVTLLIGAFYLLRGLFILIRLKRTNARCMTSRATSKIIAAIIRLGIFTVLAFIFIFVTFACHLYEYDNHQAWEGSLREYLRCVANATVIAGSGTSISQASCPIKNKPNLAVLQLEIFSVFGAGIALSTWTWNHTTVHIWKQAWKRLVSKDGPIRRLSQQFQRQTNRVNSAVEQGVPPRTNELQSVLTRPRSHRSVVSIFTEDDLESELDLTYSSANISMPYLHALNAVGPGLSFPMWLPPPTAVEAVIDEWSLKDGSDGMPPRENAATSSTSIELNNSNLMVMPANLVQESERELGSYLPPPRLTLYRPSKFVVTTCRPPGAIADDDRI